MTTEHHPRQPDPDVPPREAPAHGDSAGTPGTAPSGGPAVRRRDVLVGGGGAVAGALAAWAAGALGAREATTPAGGSADGAAAAVEGAVGTTPEDNTLANRTVDWRGTHQAGIATDPQGHLPLLAFDLLPGTTVEALRRLMLIWSDDIDRLTSGRGGISDSEPELAQTPANLTVTLGVGPGFFDTPGLESERPEWLRQLPPFTLDRLEERWNGGDLALQICGEDPISVSHAARFLAKEARDFTTLRWTQTGFRGYPGEMPAGRTMRNLFGQLDGTRNAHPDDHPELVWLGDDAPAWLRGGTTMVVRRIAMDLDTWDEVDRSTRDNALGRRLDTGAPVTGTDEFDEPDLEARNELGFPRIDLAAHIRRTRTDDPTQRMFRRVYNYELPPTEGRLSDAGLLFITFQADVDHQFTALQARMDEMDLLNTWITAIGSAVFAVPGGVREEGELLLGPLLDRLPTA